MMGFPDRKETPLRSPLLEQIRSETPDHINKVIDEHFEKLNEEGTEETADLKTAGVIEDLKALKQVWIERAEQNEDEKYSMILEGRIGQVQECIDIVNSHLNINQPTPSPVKTLQECKDEVARRHGRTDWDDCMNKVSINEWSFTVLDELSDEATELYASSKQSLDLDPYFEIAKLKIYIKKLQAAQQSSEWIRVADRQPPWLINVLVLHSIESQPFCTRGYLHSGGWAVMGWKRKSEVSFEDIKYWMPLPELPKPPSK